MIRSFIAVSFLLLVLSPGSAVADRPTGVQLLQECRQAQQLLNGSETVDVYDATSCIQYLAGFRDAMDIWEVSASPRAVCVPSEVTVEQLIRVTVKYVEDHPEDLHLDHALLVFTALAQAFQCFD